MPAFEKTRGIIDCKSWGSVDFASLRVHVLILERGAATCLERFPLIQGNRMRRYDSLQQICDAVKSCHKLSHVHGDIKPENIVCIDTPYPMLKLIDFDNATPLGQNMLKHCTPENCPPEMAAFILGHTTGPVVAHTSFDVWCAAVLTLKIFFKGDQLLEFMHLSEHDDILRVIAHPDFSFQRSLEETNLKPVQRERLAKCLEVDPARRGTLGDLLAIIPVTENENSRDLASVTSQLNQMNRNFGELSFNVESSRVIVEQSYEAITATLAKVLETKEDLMRAI
ncbi:hypothetical protein As57867_007372, partial [Aphanomyces stellatus]